VLRVELGAQIAIVIDNLLIPFHHIIVDGGLHRSGCIQGPSEKAKSTFNPN
jgi:hypothetical protein